MQSQAANHNRYPTPTGIKIEDDDLDKYLKSTQPYRESVITNKEQVHGDKQAPAFQENQNFHAQSKETTHDRQQIQSKHEMTIFTADDKQKSK